MLKNGFYIIVLTLLVNSIRSQCIVKNGDFSQSYPGKNRGLSLLPTDWFIMGRFVFTHDDYKSEQYSDRTRRTLYWQFMTPWDSTSRFQVVTMLYNLSNWGHKNREALTGQLTAPLEKDSLYEISLDIYYPSSDSSFLYKYYPVFLCSKLSDRTIKKRLQEVRLYKQDSSIVKGKEINHIKGVYKASGTEKFIHISTNIDHKSCVIIIKEQRAKQAAKNGAMIVFDNVCVKKIKDTRAK